MSTRIARVDDKLIEVFELIQLEVATKIKEMYSLDKITLSGTIASRILAERYNGKENIPFRIRKTSLTEGVIEIDL